MQTRPRPRRLVQKLKMRQPCVHGVPGIELKPHQIVLRPLVTEKGTHQSTRYNSYTFQVNLLADKKQIADAVHELFNVRVTNVRTQTRKGKKTRFRFAEGKQSSWKKAIVTLHEEDRIEFF